MIGWKIRKFTGTFKLVSPSKPAVVTKQSPFGSELLSSTKSHGNGLFLATRITSPTQSSIESTDSMRPFRTKSTGHLFSFSSSFRRLLSSYACLKAEKANMKISGMMDVTELVGESGFAN